MSAELTCPTSPDRSAYNPDYSKRRGPLKPDHLVQDVQMLLSQRALARDESLSKRIRDAIGVDVDGLTSYLLRAAATPLIRDWAQARYLSHLEEIDRRLGGETSGIRNEAEDPEIVAIKWFFENVTVREVDPSTLPPAPDTPVPREKEKKKPTLPQTRRTYTYYPYEPPRVDGLRISDNPY